MAISSQDVKASRLRRSIETIAVGLLLLVSFIRQKVVMIDDIVRMQQATEGGVSVFSFPIRGYVSVRFAER